MDIILTISGSRIALSADSLKELREEFKLEVVTRIFENEYRHCNSKSHAVLNTAAILDVDERYVWKILKEWECKNVPNSEED